LVSKRNSPAKRMPKTIVAKHRVGFNLLGKTKSRKEDLNEEKRSKKNMKVYGFIKIQKKRGEMEDTMGNASESLPKKWKITQRVVLVRSTKLRRGRRETRTLEKDRKKNREGVYLKKARTCMVRLASCPLERESISARTRKGDNTDCL